MDGTGVNLANLSLAFCSPHAHSSTPDGPLHLTNSHLHLLRDLPGYWETFLHSLTPFIFNSQFEPPPLISEAVRGVLSLKCEPSGTATLPLSLSLGFWPADVDL